MAGPIDIAVWQGDIAELEVDALVIAASESLFMVDGPAASVRRRGGASIERDATAQGPVEAGTAIVTHAGTLAASYVIHAVGVGHARHADRHRLAAAIRAAMALTAPLQLRHIAVSLLGVEYGTFVASEAAEILVDELTRASETGPAPETIVIVTSGSTETRAVAEALALERARPR